MRLLSIHVGRPKEVSWEGERVLTGIFKAPVPGPVRVRRLNLDGDEQADLSVHGGVDKAIYAYGEDAYPWWRRELPGRELPHGSFGENLVFSSLDESAIAAGDEFRLGGCRLQAVQPRFPCYKLGIKFGDVGILKTFMKSGRSGVYFRVLEEGPVAPGDELRPERTVTTDRVTIDEIFRFKTTGGPPHELLERMARSPHLLDEWREKARRKLDR